MPAPNIAAVLLGQAMAGKKRQAQVGPGKLELRVGTVLSVDTTTAEMKISGVTYGKVAWIGSAPPLGPVKVLVQPPNMYILGAASDSIGGPMGITTITSLDGSIIVTNPTGPTTDLSATEPMFMSAAFG